jgi:predicted RNA binding protein YcfA (HicA-like mRNA interferase family)
VSFDDLSGRQLDLAIARHVFGHQVEERRDSRTGELDAVYNAGMDADAPIWVRVPSYSISLDASIQVELELQKKGWKRQEVRAGSHWNEPGGVRVILEHADGRTVGAFGHPNEALCRAALKAVKQA